jgi:hypothetical protein
MTQIFRFGGIIKFKLDSDVVLPHAHQLKKLVAPKNEENFRFGDILKY